MVEVSSIMSRNSHNLSIDVLSQNAHVKTPHVLAPLTNIKRRPFLSLRHHLELLPIPLPPSLLKLPSSGDWILMPTSIPIRHHTIRQLNHTLSEEHGMLSSWIILPLLLELRRVWWLVLELWWVGRRSTGWEGVGWHGGHLVVWLLGLWL